MPVLFNIVSKDGTYPVELKANSANEFLAKHPDAYVIIDKALTQYVKLLPTQKLLEFEAIEENKEYEAVADYIQNLSDKRLNRKSIIIAIGGGVIQDIVSFIASIYMRGVSWHYLPTTLLGMVDSCIGGKSSINIRGKKNLVGTYFPPLSILIDPNFIKTLKSEQRYPYY